MHSSGANGLIHKSYWNFPQKLKDLLYLLYKVHQPQNGSSDLTQSKQDGKELHSSVGIFVTFQVAKKVSFLACHPGKLLS